MLLVVFFALGLFYMWVGPDIMCELVCGITWYRCVWAFHAHR